MNESRRNLREGLSQAELMDVMLYNASNGSFVVIKTNSKKIKPGFVAGALLKSGHIGICIRRTRYLAHRLAWLYMTGHWPHFDIDHINGNAADNRWVNLREAKPSENLCNRGTQRNNTSGYKNVSWSKAMKMWEVRLSKGGRQHIIGHFPSKEIANEHAIHARNQLHGSFAIESRPQ